MVTNNPLAAATMTPIAVAELEQQKRVQAALTPEEYKIFLEVRARTKDYTVEEFREFYASLTKEQARIFDKGMTAARKEGGRRRTRRGNMLAMLYKKMTHTRRRKHRGGNEVPDYVVKNTLARTENQRKANKKAWHEVQMGKVRRVLRHAKTRKRGKKTSEDEYYK